MWWSICIQLCYKFPTESNSERILKIGQYSVKLWARVRCLVFLTHGVDHDGLSTVSVRTIFLMLCQLLNNVGSAIRTLRRCLQSQRPTENDELVTVSSSSNSSSSSSSNRFCAYKKMTKRISLYLLHTYRSMHQHITKTSVTSKTTDNTTHTNTTTSENTIKHTIMSAETTGYTL